MKKLASLAFYLLAGIVAHSQSHTTIQNPPPVIYSYVEQMPEPTIPINKYLSEHLRYPEDARLLNIQGRVILKFVVGQTGIVDSVQILRSIYPSLDTAAVKVILNMPPWKPGRQNGKPVSVYYTIPIMFKLEDNKPGKTDH